MPHIPKNCTFFAKAKIGGAPEIKMNLFISSFSRLLVFVAGLAIALIYRFEFFLYNSKNNNYVKVFESYLLFDSSITVYAILCGQ
jgi:hypothetical protein